jgi:hypothetical protein
MAVSWQRHVLEEVSQTIAPREYESKRKDG